MQLVRCCWWSFARLSQLCFAAAFGMIGCAPDPCDDRVVLTAVAGAGDDTLVTGTFRGDVTILAQRLRSEETRNFLIRLDSRGGVRWSRPFETNGLDERPRIAVSDDGAATVTGGGAAATHFDAHGEVLWRWPLRPQRSYDWETQAAALPGGLTAVFQPPDLVVLKSDGSPLWRRTFRGDLRKPKIVAAGAMLFVGCAADPPASLDIAAMSHSQTMPHVLLARLDVATGATLWEQNLGERIIPVFPQLDWIPHPAGRVIGLAQGASIPPLSRPGAPSEDDLSLFAVDGDGRMSWSRDAGTELGFFPLVRRIASDSSGRTILVGIADDASLAIRVFDADGVVQLRNKLQPLSSKRSWTALSIAAGGEGGERILVAGMVERSGQQPTKSCDDRPLLFSIRPSGELDRNLIGMVTSW